MKVEAESVSVRAQLIPPSEVLKTPPGAPPANPVI